MTDARLTLVTPMCNDAARASGANTWVARGEVVTIDSKYGVRVSSVEKG